MNKLIVIGDLHFKSTQPFYYAQKEFISWVHKQEWNNENNIYMNLGDTFHNSLPDPVTNSLVLEFFQGLNFKKTYCLHGSHDYNGVKKQTALTILKELEKDIEIIEFIKKIKIGNLNCLCMPYFYPSQIRDREIYNMYSFYNNLPENYIKDKYDFLFSHIEDETMNFGNSKYVDISQLNIENREMGHIHLQSKNYLGVPIITRYDEKNQKGRILEIDIETKEKKYYEVPQFIDYVDVDYPNDLIFDKANYTMFSIRNCIDKNSAESFYRSKYKDRNLYFRAFYKKNEDNENIINNDLDDSLSLDDHVTNFFKENKDIKESIKDLFFNYWKKYNK